MPSRTSATSTNSVMRRAVKNSPIEVDPVCATAGAAS
jgi:hypothetical protein